jgi:hypothetical protein
MEVHNKYDNHRCHGRDASEKPPECDAEVRNTRLRRSCRGVKTYDDGGTYGHDELLAIERIYGRCLPTLCARFCNALISSCDRDVCLIASLEK